MTKLLAGAGILLLLAACAPAALVTDGLIVHLRADALGGLSDGQPVANWPDSATADPVNASLASAGLGLPTYAANALNSRPAVRFVRSRQDVLVSPEWTLPDPAAGLTVITVATGGDSGGVERALQVGAANGTASAILAVDVSADRSGARFNNGYCLTPANQNPLTPGAFHLAIHQLPQHARHDGLFYAVNSTQPQATTANNPNNTIAYQAPANHISLGNGRSPSATWYSDFYNGYLAEVLVYNRQLTTAEIATVALHLADKYALPFDGLVLNLVRNPFHVATGPQASSKVAVYDGSMEHYNGWYYLYGTGSAGDVYASRDLVNWQSPKQWLSPNAATLPAWVGNTLYWQLQGYGPETYNRYGAGDVFFHNGVMFWCFNAMATAGGNPATLNDPDPEFYHFCPDHPYSRGIDGQFFVSHTGELLYIRKVNPGEPLRGDGSGEAWIFQLGDSFFNDPFDEERLNGNWGHELLTGQKGRWDNLDYFNFEGPELFWRNGQYYLLYVGNKMDAETGLYDTGVAQNSDWRNITNADKYPGKLLARSFEDLLLEYDPILPTCEHGGLQYRYTFAAPPAGWQLPGFDDSAWLAGDGGFGYPRFITGRNLQIRGISNDNETNEANIWSSPTGPGQIWLRREFTLDQLTDSLVLRQRLAGNGAIYLNGHQLYSHSGYNQCYRMDPIDPAFLNVGANVISAAVTARTGLEGNHIDLGIYDTRDLGHTPDVTGPSQPHLARGPNGFEDWIVYKAFWNALNGQGMDRVFFWNDEMVVDGPSPDLNVQPAAPAFQDDFDQPASLANYENLPAEIYLDADALFFDSNGPKDYNQALLANLTAANVFIEANIKFADDPGALGRAGIVAWHRDDDNWVRVYIERTSNRLFVPWSFDGARGSASFPLPATFSYLDDDPRVAGFGEQYHTLRVYKNAGLFFAQLDHYHVNAGQPILDRPETATPARVGLAAFQSRNWVDNLTVSTGWEETDAHINGWNPAWPVTAAGITSPAAGQHFAAKGDPALAQEFFAYLDTDTLPAAGRAGLSLPYIDNQNALVAAVDYATRRFELCLIRDGQESLLASAPTTRDTVYGYSNFEGVSQTAYNYHLRGTAAVSRARALWLYGPYGHLGIDYLLPNPNLDSFGIDRWQDGQWLNVPADYVRTGRNKYEEIPFHNETLTSRLRLRVPAANNRPFTFAVREEIASRNFIRLRRENGRVFAWLNKQLIAEIPDPFDSIAARAALHSQNCPTTFDSITCFNIPAPIPAGDFNGDYRVDAADLLLLAERWLTQPGHPNYAPNCDLDQNGIVNLHDLTIFTNHWLQGLIH